VKKLETRLGARLLNRTTRHVSLTETGRQFLELCAPHLAALEQARTAIAEARGTPSGVLRLTLPRLVATQFIAPHLPQFLARYPAVSVELRTENQLVELVSEGLDAGIRLGESIEKDMVAVPLVPQVRLVVVGSPAYFRRYGRPGEPEDLLGHNCIRFRFPTSGRVYRWELQRGGEEVEIAVRGNLTLSDSELVCDAAARGIGLAYVLQTTAAPHLAAGRLETALDEYGLAFPGFYVYYPSRELVPAKLRAFIDFMRERIASRSGTSEALAARHAAAQLRAPKQQQAREV
jgi:DNA-binding transcriptional LysR family regulator